MRKYCLHIFLREQGVEKADGAAARTGGEPGGVSVESVTPVGADRPLPTTLQRSNWVPSAQSPCVDESCLAQAKSDLGMRSNS